MGKVSRVNVAAAKAQRDILRRDGKPVPRRIEIIASYKGGRTPTTRVERVGARAGDNEFHPATSSMTVAAGTEGE